MAQEFRSAAELIAAAGKSLGASDWLTVDQQRIDRFADATDDHQWIHVDTARAAAGSFGGTIAHGYLTLSLVNALLPHLIAVPNAVLAIHRGCNKVRFPAPVPSGSRIRAVGDLATVTPDTASGGVDVAVRVTIEIEGHAKPACVAETVSRYFFESPIP
ncbi:MAG TPA: MaoC family dehydratase [Myxococcota bacterium]|nr:MaoC family dehydratase [Myxococcota bacterium]